MTDDKCRPVEVDGEVIRVHGGGEMDATDREFFAEIVRAAKRRFADEPQPCPDCAAGRHHACDGCAWAGGLVACPCGTRGHR